ncbi:unnamed protein product, partial [Allacma fusca]
MKRTFYIVHFPKDNTVEIVPFNWLLANKTESHWPVNTDDIKTTNLVKKSVDPLEYPKVNWEIYDCKIRGGSDSYEKACAGLEKAIENSEFELTDTDGDDRTP